MSKELGKKIRSIRLKRNLSQTEMANILGYSGKGMISRIENDSSEMSYDKLMLLLSNFQDDFKDENINKLSISSAEIENTIIETDRLAVKTIGFKELDDVLSLKVAPSQREFVAENALAIAEAYAAERVGTKTQCFIAYCDNCPVGFVSIAFGSIGADGEKDWMLKSYCLWRIMIDMDYQNHGYGKELLEAIINWCSTYPLGNSDTLYTSADVNNKKAIEFYKDAGFSLTEDYVDDEIVLKRNIGGK
ncbi:MAG: GNAT family N-acetyltransferase [Bacilli bacterium]|nr:GNAT family N-acetyltransferase [Bacilli bacterium]